MWSRPGRWEARLGLVRRVARVDVRYVGRHLALAPRVGMGWSPWGVVFDVHLVVCDLVRCVEDRGWNLAGVEILVLRTRVKGASEFALMQN